MQKAALITLLVSFCAAGAFGEMRAAASDKNDLGNGWKDLAVKSFLDKDKEIRYCESQGDNRSKVSIIVMPIQKNFEIKPVLNAVTCPTSEAAKKEAALVSVNGGYFNLGGGSSSAGSSAGYVTINGQLVSTPKDNAALVNNLKLKPFLEKIFNRSELRFIADGKGKTIVKIQPHGESVPDGFTLKHALQAGPRLLPEVEAKEEAFLRTEPDGTITDSIGCLKTAARTAFGITPEGMAVIVCVAGPKQDEFSAGMTLQQLADYMRKLGCIEAINFDGGTSTTMAIKRNPMSKEESRQSKDAKETKDPHAEYAVVCGRVPETHVKSCLIVRRLP